MLAFLRGSVLEKERGRAVILVGGMGLEVFLPLSLYERLPAKGGEVELYTCLLLREDRPEIYGFGDREERDFFLRLLKIGGVGPKTALALLSCFSVEELREAIRSEDLEKLTVVPGVGKKTARRLLLELKEEKGAPVEGEAAADAVAALINLGYRRREAEEAVREAKARGAQGIEELLKLSLAYLGRRKEGKEA
ncbi:Holliday junction DNA helicase RuvA [Ammonifex degensii KC4]|uniref:Holliday junction branch migration complex subunit RuvA n=1 Tax=Ammonifex degensii (strain DSM 10501 / KC4) TaxID=429009 RepID=C9R8U6_AMMDK|nr:Holliday junction branch migration protein RuvA [Ammonifex degensii]ACX52725.1 Holliday junction DNA helicase RuvA [Ammonifex degensii KC4]